MRAAVLTAEHRFTVETIADPSPRPGELLVAVRGCGICGSDLKAYKFLPAGSVLGHEFHGEIVAVGSDVAGQWSTGQLVTAMPLRACGQCRWCAADEPAHCEQVHLLGVGGSAGAFAEFVRVDPALTVALPNSIGDSGSLVEPLAVGLHAVNAGSVSAGDRVLVLGGGSIGSAVTVWAKRLGAREIVVSDPAPARRAAAPALGATGDHDPADGAPVGNFDVVIECVGAPSLIQTAIEAVGTRGRIVVAGVCVQPDPIVPVAAVLKEVSMHFAVYYRLAEFRAAAELSASDDFPHAAFTSSAISLADIDAAFQTPSNGKVVVTP